MSSPVECSDVRARLASYLAGEQSEAEALAIEAHAGECAACETLLEAATRIPVDGFAPPLPAELRARTLEAVSATNRTVATPARRRAAARWIAVASTFAAAAVVVLMVRPQVPPQMQPPSPRVDSAIASLPAVQRPENLADESARPEFAELERAASELEAELTKSPGDAELRTFLEAVNTRRMELERRVKDARS